MPLTAGVDIGNATTEIVIADTSVSPPLPVAWDRRPTFGEKGSRAAAEAAARVLDRLERRAGLRSSLVLTTPQVGAAATVESAPLAVPHTGRLRVLITTGAVGGGGRIGQGVGRPRPVDSDPPLTAGDPVVLVAADPLGFRRTAAHVRTWLDSATPVAGVVLNGQEARLVAARLPTERAIPVVAATDTEAVLAAALAAVEVATEGDTLRSLADPVWLSVHLGEPDAAATREAAARCAGAPAAVVLLGDSSQTTRVPESARQPDGPPAVSAVADSWSVELTAATLPRLPPGVLPALHRVRASLGPATAARAHPEAFEAPGRQVLVGWDETTAARAGAATTPGAAPDAVVLDLGGGTLDVLPGDPAALGTSHRTGAGCGVMLTRAVAHVLGISNGTAEWVKRGPSVRREAPQLVVDEAGARRFTDEPARTGAVGWLCVDGPAGPLPFSTALTPPEWGQTRRALKGLVIVDNLRRLAAGGLGGAQVLLVGGPAQDDELLQLLHAGFPGVTFGRADVAGVAGGAGTGTGGLGTRWAVAHGLVVLAASSG